VGCIEQHVRPRSECLHISVYPKISRAAERDVRGSTDGRQAQADPADY
jgi:hypothetical protein